MSKANIQEIAERAGFLTITLAELFIGIVIVRLLFVFVSIRENPIFFVVAIPLIVGYVVGSVWYRGKHFLEIFRYYPWERKLLSDEDIEDC